MSIYILIGLGLIFTWIILHYLNIEEQSRSNGLLERLRILKVISECNSYDEVGATLAEELKKIKKELGYKV